MVVVPAAAAPLVHRDAPLHAAAVVGLVVVPVLVVEGRAVLPGEARVVGVLQQGVNSMAFQFSGPFSAVFSGAFSGPFCFITTYVARLPFHHSGGMSQNL